MNLKLALSHARAWKQMRDYNVRMGLYRDSKPIGHAEAACAALLEPDKKRKAKP